MKHHTPLINFMHVCADCAEPCLIDRDVAEVWGSTCGLTSCAKTSLEISWQIH